MISTMRTWSDPGDGEIRRTSAAERGEMLVDLLLLTDALPPAKRRESGYPTFRELCEPR